MRFYPPNHTFFEGLLISSKDPLPDVQVFLHQPGAINPSAETILVNDNFEPNEVIAQFQDQKLQHLVQKNKNRFEQNLVSAGLLIKNPELYFESDFCFFQQDKIESLLIPFSNDGDKGNVMKMSTAFVQKIKSGTVTENTAAIIEELYMNAVKDAPAEALKNGQGQEVQRSELYLCRTQEWLQISCMDFYGSLEIRKFLNRMHEVYHHGAGAAIKMDPEAGGAGLGCVILFENSVCLILGVQKNRRSKVSCFVPLQVNNRQRTEMKKSLHWFEL